MHVSVSLFVFVPVCVFVSCFSVFRGMPIFTSWIIMYRQIDCSHIESGVPVNIGFSDIFLLFFFSSFTVLLISFGKRLTNLSAKYLIDSRPGLQNRLP